MDHDRVDLLNLLLDLGLGPDARARVEPEGEERSHSRGDMPLYECVRQRKHEMAEMLLSHGADPNGQV